MSPWTAHAQPVRTGLSSVNQFKPVFPTSLNQFDDNLHYAAHAQKLVRTGFSSLNQFSHPVWTSLKCSCIWQSTLHCTLSMTMHALKLIRTGFSSLNRSPSKFELVWSSLMEIDNLHYMHRNWFEQFEPVWTSSHSQFEPVWTLWQSTLHCSCTTNKNWFEQCELVWTSTHSQFEPVWSS